MRRARLSLFAVLCATVAIPAITAAQGSIRDPRPPRAWLVLSDGIGPNAGGISNGIGLVQLYRASGTVAVTQNYGVEVTAVRIQEIFPSHALFSDPAFNNPTGDGLIVALASFTRDGPRGSIPSLVSIGAGVMRRPTNDPAKKRLTGGFQAGVEGSLWRPQWTDRMDVTAGGRLMLMPAGNRRQLYLVALTLGLRFG